MIVSVVLVVFLSLPLRFEWQYSDDAWLTIALLSHVANPSKITPLIAVSSSPTHLVVGSSTSSLDSNPTSQPAAQSQPRRLQKKRAQVLFAQRRDFSGTAFSGQAPLHDLPHPHLTQ